MDGPSQQDLELGNYMEKVIQIDEYSKGDIFGVESLLDEQPFGYTGTTLIPTEIIIINFEEIYKFLSSEFRGSFRNEIKTYPEEEAMRKMYLEKSRWKKFKTKFLNEQIYENKLKAMQVRKQGFINMLSPKAKRKMMLPPDLIEYVKGSQKESFVDVLDRINKTTQKLTEIPRNLPQKQKYSHPVPELLAERYGKLQGRILRGSNPSGSLPKSLKQVSGNKNHSSYQISQQNDQSSKAEELSKGNFSSANSYAMLRRASKSISSKSRSVIFEEKSPSLANYADLPLPPISGKKSSFTKIH